MAKARKKSRKKAAKKKTKRRVAAKAKRPVRRKARRAKARKPAGVIETMVGAAQDAAALRSRLAGRETFED